MQCVSKYFYFKEIHNGCQKRTMQICNPNSPNYPLVKVELCHLTYIMSEFTFYFQVFNFICCFTYRIMNYPLYIEKNADIEESPIHGNRIVDLAYVLSWSIKLQYEHSQKCTSGRLYVDKEIRKNLGLVSRIVFKCTMCSSISEYFTEDPKRKKSTINYGAVWGTMATGSTYGHLEELLSCIDIPPMPDKYFYNIENDLGAVSVFLYIVGMKCL